MNYTQYFIHSKRVDGARYCYLSDDAPESLRELIHDIHLKHFNHCLPNDWIYNAIFESFENNDEDPEPDICNHDLTRWLCENGNQFATYICDEAVEQMGCGVPEDIISFISIGQQYALQCIHDAVRDFLGVQDD